MIDSSHWYCQSGSPRYTVTGANGRERPTTLRDARKDGLCPSVTTVLQVIDKPALTTWKVRQGILAALTMPKVAGESEDAYLSRILTDSQQQARDAADEGTRIHDAIECGFLRRPYPDHYQPHVAAVRAKVAELFPGVVDWIVERSFAHPSGYGGKVDLHSPSTGIVIDHKGKDGDFTDGKKLAWDQHYQLAAYQHGLCLRRAPAANLFFSRTHPGKVAAHVWTTGDIDEGLDVFLCALALWKAIKGFDSAFAAKADPLADLAIAGDF